MTSPAAEREAERIAQGKARAAEIRRQLAEMQTAHPTELPWDRPAKNGHDQEVPE